VIGQGDSPRAGYGPGITVIMTSAQGAIQTRHSPEVNLKTLLSLAD
jgi:hypothetical protein